jgi:radical SAM protein with 4Fe4S-binding SPASM domain
MAYFVDPAISRKSKIVDTALATNEKAIPIPSVVEVSESGTCNRSCAFCPRSNPNYPDIKEFVDPNLVEKLSRQLNEVNFKGIFLFSGFVEPLLDKNIFELITIVNKNLPQARVEMVTNGDALNETRLTKLFNSGLKTVLISVYDGKEDADRFEALCKIVGLDDDQFVIRHRYLPEEKDFGITLSNRAGMMEEAEFPVQSRREPMKSPCHYPHYTFFMDYNGDVLLCPHDWGKKLVIGNMNKQDFLDIWTGEMALQSRRRLTKADRAFDPCATCDVKGTLMGQKHVDAWAKLDTQND